MSDPITPNMGLIKPVTGVTSGSTANDEFNANSDRVDQHDHSSGNGVPVTPAGFNVNTDFTFNSYNATALRSARFTAQTSALALASDLGCLYVSGVDLWFNDGSGNHIQITLGAAVNATSSGISSGTASAAFVSSVLVVNADSNKPANIQAGSILIGNNVTNSKYLTLSPPNSMAADYNLVLPSLPGSTLFLTLDVSGNIGTATGISATSQLAAQSIDQSLIAIRPTSSSATSNGGIISISASGTTVTTITDLTSTFTFTCSGNPLILAFQGSGNFITLERNTPGDQIQASIVLTNSSNTVLGTLWGIQLEAAPGASAALLFYQTYCTSNIIPLAAGTYTMKLRGSAQHGSLFVGGTLTVAEMK